MKKYKYFEFDIEEISLDINSTKYYVKHINHKVINYH